MSQIESQESPDGNQTGDKTYLEKLKHYLLLFCPTFREAQECMTLLTNHKKKWRKNERN
tara:strand:- start:1079 stop:1255 length:177 start_codon:yes stop_codon:yes gene_type:complete